MPQPPNMQQMIKQVQKMQAGHDGGAGGSSRTRSVEASAGGGMVKVKVTGDLVVKSITIDPDAVDPEDPEMLQDMVLAASTRRCAPPRSSRPSKLGGLDRRHGPRRRSGLPGPRSVACTPRPSSA